VFVLEQAEVINIVGDDVVRSNCIVLFNIYGTVELLLLPIVSSLSLVFACLRNLRNQEEMTVMLSRGIHPPTAMMQPFPSSLALPLEVGSPHCG